VVAAVPTGAECRFLVRPPLTDSAHQEALQLREADMQPLLYVEW